MASAPDLSLRGGRRPTWQSREGTYSSYRLPIKRHAPIASVAALSERHAGWQHVPYFFCGARPPDLSLRGGRRPTWRPEREAPLALPLGELSPKVTERALQALLNGNSKQGEGRFPSQAAAPPALPKGELSPKVNERASQAPLNGNSNQGEGRFPSQAAAPPALPKGEPSPAAQGSSHTIYLIPEGKQT